MLTELKFNGDCKFAWQYWRRQKPEDIWGEQGKPKLSELFGEAHEYFRSSEGII